MQLLKRIFIGIISLLVIAVISLYATGNAYLLQGIRKTYLVGEKSPDIDDMELFDVRKIEHGAVDFPIKYSSMQSVTFPEQYATWNDSLGTSAYLVYWRDSLFFERYWEGDSTTLTNSFSMAKSVTALLIGCALDDGLIQSVDQPVSDFLPEFSGGMNASLTIRHLLTMTSGIPFGESYSSPFGYMARAYFGDDLKEETMAYAVERNPGILWAYEGGNTVLLGLIIEKATGKSPSAYLQEKLWKQIGAEQDAYWNLDRENGIEKTFSGLYATARDFSKIGSLFMHGGIHQGDTLISPEFVRQALTPVMIPDEKGEVCDWYGWQWWLGTHRGKSMYMCRGMRGQYVICLPELELMVVRIGHHQSKERIRHIPADLYTYIDIALAMLEQQGIRSL
ncbi:MAG: serine hydrolase domain-containing protein [Flavobacteriales bacterium]|jgi:CubicO group peptidase (beta-lactamase class C family)